MNTCCEFGRIPQAFVPWRRVKHCKLTNEGFRKNSFIGKDAMLQRRGTQPFCSNTKYQQLKDCLYNHVNFMQRSHAIEADNTFRTNKLRHSNLPAALEEKLLANSNPFFRLFLCRRVSHPKLITKRFRVNSFCLFVCLFVFSSKRRSVSKKKSAKFCNNTK